MVVFDGFSGIGGFALGIEQAGIKITKHYFSEVDSYAIKIYKRHFPDAIELGDITKITGEEIKEQIDLFTFGFPCQDLSIAGKHAGLGGSRSGLFFEATRLIRKLKPYTFIFENVKGLFSSNDGKDFEVVLREIADIGLYECEWQLVNTSWVLPQNRERIYFIGHLGERGGQKVFPITETSKNAYQGGELSKLACNTLRTNYSNAHSNETYVFEGNEKEGLDYIGAIMSENNKKWLDDGKELQRNFPQGQRVYSTKGIASSICGLAGGLGGKTGLYAVLALNRKDKRQNGRRFKADGEPMFTLTGQDMHGICGDFEIRRLTPTEGLRLQGFPDNWLEGSDTKKYMAIGNAVSVPIVKMIIERLFTSSTCKGEI